MSTSHDALGPTGPLHTANRKRSYSQRVARGTRVHFDAPTATMTSRYDDVVGDRVDAGRLEVGRRYGGVVLSESNAGFRGIEMAVELDDGRRVSGISTGAIAPARSWGGGADVVSG